MKEFEVSRRTVARDLDFLRDEERAPLAYDDARHGFRLTDETYTLPPVRISRKEAFSFGLARKLLAHDEGTPLHLDMRSVLDKIAESLAGDITIEPDWLGEHVGVLPEDRVRIDPEVWAQLAGYVERREAIRATYQTFDGRVSEYDLHPYHLLAYHGNWYALALNTGKVRESVGVGEARSGSLSGSGSKGRGMGFGHEKLDVYRAAIEYVGWAYRFCESLKGHRNAKDQLLRASQAIPLNIAAGNGNATDGDRRRYFEIARGSALECGAVQDVLQVCGALSAEENTSRKALLDRIVAMLTKLGQRGYAVHAGQAQYTVRIDPDPDSDPDADGTPEQPIANHNLEARLRQPLGSRQVDLGLVIASGPATARHSRLVGNGDWRGQNGRGWSIGPAPQDDRADQAGMESERGPG